MRIRMENSIILWLFQLLFVWSCLANDHPWQHSSLSPQDRFKFEQNYNNEPRVLITSLPRSGSTFMGRLFQENPESGYLYESSRGMGEVFSEDGCSPEPEAELGKILKEMYFCKFDTLTQWMYNYSLKVDAKTDNPYLYTWINSQTKSSPEKCLATNPNKTMMAFKEITFWSPKLKWLLDNVGQQFRIIWLVRDIRGFISSFIPFKASDTRTNMYFQWGLHKKDLWKTFEQCNWLLKNETLRKELEPLKELLKDLTAVPYKRMAAWWTMRQLSMMNEVALIPREHWMMVRYEDMSDYPFEVVQQIYSFLGKDVVNEEVLKWLMRNTQSGSVADRYGTARDASSMGKIFIERIPRDILVEIERIGEPAMKYFNYQPVSSLQPQGKPSVFYRV